MLDELQLLVTDLDTRYQTAGKSSVTFAYGRKDEINSAIADQHESGFLIFHDGYFDASPSQLANRGIQDAHQLTIWFFLPSALSDSTVTRKATLDQLTPLYHLFFSSLNKLGKVTGGRAVFYANVTDRNMDGIRLTCTLISNPIFLC